MSPFRKITSLFTCVLTVGILAVSSFGQDKKKNYELPIIRNVQPTPIPVPPTPVVLDSGNVSLTPNVLYVIKSDVPLIVTTSPKGYVDTLEIANPNSLPIITNSVFTDSIDGKFESRIYTSKWIYTVRGKDKINGSCELLVWEVGTKKDEDIDRVPLKVGDKPDDKKQDDQKKDDQKKDDKKDVPPIVIPRKLQIVIIEETASARLNRAAFFTDPELAAWIKDKGHFVPQIIDQNAKATGPNGETIPAPDAQPYINEAKKYPLPRLFIIDPAVKVDMTANPPITNVLYNGPMVGFPKELIETGKKLGG